MSAPEPAWDAERIVAHLTELRSDANREGMARFGIRTEAALGIPNPVLWALGKTIGRDHDRAKALWSTGVREARLLALDTAERGRLTQVEAEAWAAEFDSWEIVDKAADTFAEAGLAAALVPRFAADEREFVRRAAFAMIAWSSVNAKQELEATFIAWLPLIEDHATDERNYVRKAVNWALRQIGKRSIALHARALETAERLAVSDDRTARWIGKDAVRELSAEKIVSRITQARVKL